VDEASGVAGIEVFPQIFQDVRMRSKHIFKVLYYKFVDSVLFFDFMRDLFFGFKCLSVDKFILSSWKFGV